ncbi:hypothetical protein FF098_014855 [Parvularcula flava]|uniref:DUF6950 domain-containing protein n=1 Tax=Aquisalinus luteolus TaxID=1566827 RepID=A0A8J3A4V4_9PROT|nr:hypothetical protein [Aquisalinus luteolus]NHK29198.1 hypothetical protein [Aquisalinus luteolus]GGI00003.1 hypothetical protein GCM10011355_27270 [Aquisalinus luteolus]
MRLVGWEERLAAVIDGARRKDFVWSAHDCCTFPADCVAALTGTDPMADIRGTYETARQALELINQEGGIADMVSARMPWAHQVSSLKAHRGDIVHLEQQGLDARLAVVYGTGCIAPEPHGLAFLPLPKGAVAWHVPFAS